MRNGNKGGHLSSKFLPVVPSTLLLPAIEQRSAAAYACLYESSIPMAHPLRTTYPNSIRHFRRRAGLRLYEVAHYLNLSSPTHVAKWEKGQKVPTAINLLKLAAVLKVPPEVLYLDRLKDIRKGIEQRKTIPIKKPL
jgi:DNA-binding transcriptional regulator YiaG